MQLVGIRTYIVEIETPALDTYASYATEKLMTWNCRQNDAFSRKSIFFSSKSGNSFVDNNRITERFNATINATVMQKKLFLLRAVIGDYNLTFHAREARLFLQVKMVCAKLKLTERTKAKPFK